jgi:hypothetical protein
MSDAKPTTISEAMIYLLKRSFRADEDPSVGLRGNACLQHQ